MAMKLPIHQQAIGNGMYFMSGIIGIGVFLDAVNSSVSLSPIYTFIFAGALIVAWATIEMALRMRARRWVLRGGQLSSVKKLGIKPRLAFAGALSLLLVPKIFLVASQISADNSNQTNVPKQTASLQQPQTPQNDIQILGGYLEPRPLFFNDAPEARGHYEVASLNFNVKNYSDKPLMLTSMEATVTGGRDAQLLSGGSRGIEILGENPNAHDPIIIEPGEVKMVSYERGLYLPGIASFFLRESAKRQPIVLVPYGNRHTMLTTYPALWIEALNEEFKSLYGEDLTIKVTLFSNFRKLVKTFEVKLSEGESTFKENGKLEHGFFVGDTLLLLNQTHEIKATVYPRN